METNPITVLFFGVQGSGKGTQAELLIKYLNEHSDRKTLYLETGELLREFTKKDGYTNRLVKDIVETGGLLPSFMPVYVIGEAMAERFTGAEHLILDGATRRENQTRLVDSMFRFYGRTPYHIINIKLSEDSAVTRLLGRGRSDDTEEKIRKRLAWSQEHMDAIMKQFETFECTIHEIDGEPSVEEIHKEILSVLGLHHDNQD